MLQIRLGAGSFRSVQWVPGILLALIKRERATSKSWMFVYKPIAGRQLSQNVGWLRFVHVITKFLKISDKERDSNRKFWNLGLSVKFEMPWVVLWPDNTQQCHKQKTRRESEATTAASEESEVRIVQQQITLLNTRYLLLNWSLSRPVLDWANLTSIRWVKTSLSQSW